MNEDKKNSTPKILVIFLIVALSFGIIFLVWFTRVGNKTPTINNVLGRIPIIGTMFASEPAEEQSLLEKLEEEKNLLEAEWEKINRQVDEISQKQEELKKKELELQAKEMELNQEKAKIEETLTDLKSVAQYYELMESSKAAKIIETLEDEIAIKIFKNMKKEAVAEILSNMEPKKAAAITKKLSGIQ
ncbi:MAG: magnesium transporter MgtE [Thermosediminibacteraceae bacterium]|nr:magnesium transporter MgtE [Thermosediminibacteraceae bacterium]